MLNTFIKFNHVGYCEPQECETEVRCLSSDEYIESLLPAKPSDTIKVIVNKSDAEFYRSQHLKVVLTDECGTVNEDIELEYQIEESTNQYFISVSIPNLKGVYRIALQRDINIEISSYTPESSEGACDGIVTFEVPNPPAQQLEWSTDNITFQSSSTFTGVCAELVTVYVRVVGDECNSGEAEFNLEPVDCSFYKGWTLQQFKDAGVRLFQLYNCTLNDIKP